MPRIANAWKYLIIAILIFFVIVACIIIYRIYFIFDNKSIERFAEQKAKLLADPDTAYKLIIDQVQAIKHCPDTVAGIRIMAKENKTSMEQEIVNAAFNSCVFLGWFPEELHTSKAA